MKHNSVVPYTEASSGPNSKATRPSRGLLACVLLLASGTIQGCATEEEEPAVQLSARIIAAKLDTAAKKYTLSLSISGTEGAKFDAAIASASDAVSCGDARMDRQVKGKAAPSLIELVTTYQDDPTIENRLVCVHAKKKNGSGDREGALVLKSGIFDSNPKARSKPALPPD